MSRKKAATLSGDLVVTKGSAVPISTSIPGERTGMIQTTLRLDSRRYEALRMASIRLRRPAKDIMIEAFDAFLKTACPELAKEIGL